jgi:hypothetical protein
MTSPGCVKCEIYDNAVGEIYHSDTGATEADAMEKAIRGAVNAVKPLTKAQRLGQQAAAANAVKDENESLKARIAELEAAIASKKK